MKETYKKKTPRRGGEEKRRTYEVCWQDMHKRRTHIQVIGNNRTSIEQKVLLIKIPHTKVWGAVNNYKRI